VDIGTKASVLVRAYRDKPLPGTVTRTSWALNVKSRTLRAEIDLPNPGSKLLPGMYAYSKVIIERPGIHALPISALTHSGDKTFCWTYEDGHAKRTEVRTGVSDADWIEVTNINYAKKQPQTADNEDDDAWATVTGSEEILLGDLSTLSDGEKVEIDPTGKDVKKSTGSAAVEPRAGSPVLVGSP
jgi:hypothetical protein